MKKLFTIAAVALAALTATPADATEAFSVKVTRVEADVYRIDGMNYAFVETKGCQEAAKSTTAILIINNATGKGGTLAFLPSKVRCEIVDMPTIKYGKPQTKAPIVANKSLDSVANAAQLAANDVIAALRNL